MKFTKLCFAAVPAALFLAACGSPEGKFQNSDSLAKVAIDTNLKFIKVHGATQWDPSWSKENVVVYHWKAEPDDLHPTNGITSARRVVMDYTQRFMISADLEQLSARPDLVKAMPTISADGLQFTYELRDEPMWDDGAQLSVDDIIFTMMAAKCPLTENGYAKPYFEFLKEIVKDPTNPRKFTFVMKGPYIQNILFVGDQPVMERKYHDPDNILSKYTLAQFDDPAFSKTKHPDLEKWAKEFNDPKYGRDPKFLNGLGAYKVTAWEDKQRIELTRKTNHWTSKLQNPDMYNTAYPEKIIFKIIADDNSIALGFAQQTIDASSWVSTKGLAELQKDSAFNRNYHSAYLQNFDYQYLGMNLKPAAVNRQPFFTDKRVRRAIALLTPVDQLNKDYMFGKAFRMTSLVSPIKKGVYDNTLKPIPYDVAQANKLLDEAGWKDTDGDNIRDKMIDGKKVQFECELLIASGPVYERMATDVANAMYPAGLKVNVRTMEFVATAQAMKQHNFDMYLGAWGGAFAADDYKQVWHSTSYDNGSNYIGYSSAEADVLIDSIRITIDDAKRIPMEKRLQKLIYDDQPYVFLFSSLRKIVIHKRFDNDDFYFEKPGMYLSNLRLMSPGNMAKPMPPL